MVGSQGLMGEDSDLVRRLARHGHKVGFAPKAVVRHIIHHRQVSIGWMQKRFFRHGRTMFMAEDVRQDADRLVFAFPWRKMQSAVRSMGCLLLIWPVRNKAEMFRRMTTISYDLGAIKQALVLSRR